MIYITPQGRAAGFVDAVGLSAFERRTISLVAPPYDDLPHPVAIPKPPHTPQDGGASQGAG